MYLATIEKFSQLFYMQFDWLCLKRLDKPLWVDTNGKLKHNQIILTSVQG